MLYFTIKAALSGFVCSPGQTQSGLWSAPGVASVDLDHGSHLIVAGHHGSGKHCLTDGSDVLVGAAVVADVSAGAAAGMPAQRPFGGDRLIAFLQRRRASCQQRLRYFFLQL